MTDGSQFGTGFALLLVIAGIVLFLVWVLLPFAVFGVKDRLREISRQQSRTNELLQMLVDDGRARSKL